MHFASKHHKLKISLLLLIFQHAHTHTMADGPPRKLAIADHERIIFAHVNQSLALKCPIEKKESNTFVEWTRGGESLYMQQGYEITLKGFLKIKSVTKEHAGLYTCEGINGYGSIRVNITVIVDNPEAENLNNTPSNLNSANRVHGFPPVIKKRPSSFAVDVGGQATFHCVSSGHPTPHIFFIKDGHLIKDTEMDISNGRAHSTLKLRGLNKSDAGVYKCIARNKMGEDEMDFTLYVTDPSAPPKIVALEPSSVTIKEGATAVFWCEVNSKSGLKLHIKWLKRLDNKDMGDSVKTDDITLFRSGSTYYRPLNLTDVISTKDGVHKSKLLLRNSGKQDSGTYVCLALNDKGFNFKNVSLTVISSDKPLSSPPYFSQTNGTSLVVTITVACVVILAVIILVSHLYCKVRSAQKGSINKAAIINPQSGNVRQNISSVRKPGRKGPPHPEVSDLQSKSKLLCCDSAYCYEHTENQISKSSQIKTYVH